MKHTNTLKISVILAAFFALSQNANAQLYIKSGATFHIESGATVTVDDMDVISNANITGAGTVSMKGTAVRNLNMNGNSLPVLDVANASNVNLASNAIVNNNLNFTSGKLVTGANNLTLANNATTSGASSSSYIETSGSGVVNKNVNANQTNFVIPVGTATTYNPLSITTVGTYSSANVSARAVSGVHPNKVTAASDYTNVYWPITQTGITGTLNASGTYVDPANIASGTEAGLRGMVWDGATWDNTSTVNNVTTNENGALIAGNGDLYAQNEFISLNAKAFLQGPFVGASSLMNDNLRTVTSFPLTSPYGVAPYTQFAQVANPVTETINPSVLTVAGNDAIVDWVLLELRDNSGVNPGALVKYTRSALIQRDGDIVDLDGTSPVSFRNAPSGSQYTLAIRHRNHLGMATAPATNLLTLGTKTNTPQIDFTTMTDPQIHGTSTAYKIVSTKNVMVSGDVNGNRVVRYNGINNDRLAIVAYYGATPLTNTFTNVYAREDVNMNGQVRYNGIGNDRLVILANLSSPTATLNEQLPN